MQRRDAESRERIILTRKLMWSNLAPWSKGITEEKLWPLDFLDKTEPATLPTEDELQKSIERWKLRDEKLLKKTD